jgi:uracil-DNA glycosylase
MTMDPIDRIPKSWRSRLSEVASRPAFAETLRKVDDERRSFTIYPPEYQTFAALELTPPESIRVVILGQDPYPGAGMANGLAFSVAAGAQIPASLQNIIKSMSPDLSYTEPASGSLEPWARQGVLLLNTVLTVCAGEANSHRGLGWRSFTNAVIQAVNDSAAPVIFLLWGKQAQASGRLVTAAQHSKLQTSHPSPLSARLGFFQDRPLQAANAILRSAGRPEIDWTLS